MTESRAVSMTIGIHRPRCSKPARHFESIETRQHRIEDHDPVLVLSRHPHRVRTVGRHIHRVTLFLEASLDQAGHPGLVLNDQKAHSSRLGTENMNLM